MSTGARDGLANLQHSADLDGCSGGFGALSPGSHERAGWLACFSNAGICIVLDGLNELPHAACGSMW